MLKAKEINVIEIELKLALGEKVSPAVLKELSIDYAWAHSKVKPPHSNYKILSSLKYGEYTNPFLKIGSLFKMTFFSKKYLYVSGTAGCCIASSYSRNEVEKTINKITEEMAMQCFIPNKNLPQNYFDQARILDLLK